MNNIDIPTGIIPVSASPEFVTKMLNKTGALEKITKYVVIYFDKQQFDVYRESSGGPDVLSRETYDLRTMKKIAKDKMKYHHTINFQKELGYTVKMKGIEFSAFVEIDETLTSRIVTTLNLKGYEDPVSINSHSNLPH